MKGKSKKFTGAPGSLQSLLACLW